MHSEKTTAERFEWFRGYMQTQVTLFQHREPVVPGELLAAFWRVLRKFTDAEIEAAFRTCLERRKVRGLPMPAEVLEHVRVTAPAASALAAAVEVEELTPEMALRQAAWAAFASWLFRSKRYGLLENAEARRRVVADFDTWCREADGGKRAHLAGQIDPEAVKS